MSNRHLRGAIIEHIEHPKTKRVGVIRLDKKRMMFYARENDADAMTEPFANANGFLVKQWLLEQLKFSTDAQNMDWQPVISISSEGERDRYSYRDQKEYHGESIEVKIDRYYIGLTRDERQWLKLSWAECDPKSTSHVPENERYGVALKYGIGPKSPDISDHNKPFRFPSFKDGYRRDESILPYTPELWAALTEILETLARSRETLKNLITTKAGIETLKTVGAGKIPLLLAAGSEKK